MVPLGPRLVLRTSIKPLAALMFMCSAADLLSTSAFGFSTLSDIFFGLGEPEWFLSRESERERCALAVAKVTELWLETEEKKKQEEWGF